MAIVEPAYTLLKRPQNLVQENDFYNLKEQLLVYLESHELNEKQKKAFITTFMQKLTLLWGPPGTGKTKTLSEIIKGWLENYPGKLRILIGSNNYNVIDSLLEKSSGFNLEYEILRVRSSTRESYIHNKIKDLTSSNKKEFYNEITQENKHIIVGATWMQLLKLVNENAKKKVESQELFDLIIIDEASQVSTSTALAYFLLAKKDAHFILSGDPKQLGPIYAYDPRKLENFIFDNIFTYFQEQFKIKEVSLNETYRSNNEISSWPAVRFYDNDYTSVNAQQLLSLDVGERKKPIDWPKDLFWSDILYDIINPENPVIALVHDDTTSTLSNKIESELASAITFLYYSLINDKNEFWTNLYGIVTPHRAQISSIRNQIACFGNKRLNHEIELGINTVDKYQGDERDFILASYAVSDKDFISSEEDFILSARRFNVTLTRARKKFILLISKSLIEYLSDDIEIAKEGSSLQMFVSSYCSLSSNNFKMSHNNQDINIQIKQIDKNLSF